MRITCELIAGELIRSLILKVHAAELSLMDYCLHFYDRTCRIVVQ